MQYKPITCQTLLKKITKKDTLFNGKYTLDPYQYCEFQCRYCDSSSETSILVKINAPQLLEKELQNITKGTIIIGSVHDPYQPVEQEYHITKKLLQLIKNHHFPCHILTKSTAILQDIDLIQKMTCNVTISLPSLNTSIIKHLEPNTPTPHQRLQTLSILNDNKIHTGIAIIPLLPYLIEPELEKLIATIQHHGAHYALHQYLELKGDQKEKFYICLETIKPDLIQRYKTLYQEKIKPDEKYQQKLTHQIERLCKKYHLKSTIPE